MIIPIRHNYSIGVIYECLGVVDWAKEFYEKAGEYDRERGRLEEIFLDELNRTVVAVNDKNLKSK